jgi:uncharacterized protein
VTPPGRRNSKTPPAAIPGRYLPFYMTLSKQYSILTFLLVTVLLTATCQTTSSNKDNQRIKNPVLFNHSFVDSLPQPSDYVNQYAFIYSPSEVSTIDSLIADFEKKTTIQIAVISFDTSMFERDSLEAVTLKIAKFWGVGQKDKNNGVVIGICSGYRKMNIQNGYGIEKILTNEETKEIIDSAFIPSFREYNYFEGTMKGLKSLMKILGSRTEPNK